jgi:hypothetical protein
MVKVRFTVTEGGQEFCEHIRNHTYTMLKITHTNLVDIQINYITSRSSESTNAYRPIK